MVCALAPPWPRCRLPPPPPPPPPWLYRCVPRPDLDEYSRPPHTFCLFFVRITCEMRTRDVNVKNGPHTTAHHRPTNRPPRWTPMKMKTTNCTMLCTPNSTKPQSLYPIVTDPNGNTNTPLLNVSNSLSFSYSTLYLYLLLYLFFVFIFYYLFYFFLFNFSISHCLLSVILWRGAIIILVYSINVF